MKLETDGISLILGFDSGKECAFFVSKKGPRLNSSARKLGVPAGANPFPKCQRDNAE